MTENGVSPTRMNGVDRRSDPFVELFKKPQAGYHGVLYVGQISAAGPANDEQTGDKSDQSR